MASAKELAIKTLYVFSHSYNIPIKRIGVFPDERKKSVDTVIRNNRSHISSKDIENEICNIVIKHFVR